MMATKTTISIDQSLLEKVKQLARILDISRSQLFAKAAAEYIARHRNQAILNKLNEVYAEPPDEEEREFLDAAFASLAKLR